MKKYSRIIVIFFLFMGSLLLCLFASYVLFRQFKNPQKMFDASILNGLRKDIIYGIMVTGLTCMLLTSYAISLLRKKLFSKADLVIGILCGCFLLVLILGFLMIKRTEGQFLMKSKYFRFYLMAAIPTGVSVLLYLTSFLFSKKEG